MKLRISATPRRRRNVALEHPDRIRESHRKATTAGFSMIEMVFVMAIIGILAAIITPKLQANIERARIGKATGDIRAIQADIQGYMAGNAEMLPLSLADVGRAGAEDPWGNPYVYTPLSGAGRTDQFNLPLNLDYDLYSRGKDGATAQSLGAPASQDDIVRALDGSFVGLAQNF